MHRRNCTADQRLRKAQSFVFLKSVYELLVTHSMTLHAGLCRNCADTSLLVFSHHGSFINLRVAHPCIVFSFIPIGQCSEKRSYI